MSVCLLIVPIIQIFSPETSNDEYAKEVLSKALFIFAFDDVIKEGDGDRVYRIWKYLLLIIFREDAVISTR